MKLIKSREIWRGPDLLIRRFYVFPRGPRDEGGGCPFSIKVHHLISSDSGDLHDHPWPFLTIILRRGYWEETPKGLFWRGAGSVVFHRATDLHKLTIPEGGAWSLFINWRRRREWGFQTAKGWIPWHQYD